MKEPVRRTKHPYMVGVVVSIVAVAYFALMFMGGPKDQSRSLDYGADIYAFVELEDDVDMNFTETARLEANYPGLSGLAIAKDGRVYVAAEDVVAVFSPEGELEKEHRFKGVTVSICVAPDGVVLLGMENMEEHWAYVAELREDGSLDVLHSMDAPTYPTSIAADDESIFVAMLGGSGVKDAVLHLDRRGNLVNKIAVEDPTRQVPGLLTPGVNLDLSLDNDGNLWVVNPGKLGVESYRKNGDLITSWYKPSMKLDGFSGCCNPAHIAFTPDGKLITAEKGLVRIKVYDAAFQEFEELVAGRQEFPKEKSVHDLAVDANNRILVLDPRHNAVRIFERTEESHERTAKSA